MLTKALLSLISRQGKRYRRYILLAYLAFSTLLLTIKAQRVQANGIFSAAQKAMTCIINASGGGNSNAIISSLPSVIFTAISLFLFAYFVGSSFQLVQAVRAGEEVSQLVIPILAAIIGVIVITIFQNILFGSGGC